MGEQKTVEERLQVQSARLKDAGGLGRSDALVRLFDFLLAQTLAGRVPKEVEIAQDVFDKQGSVDVMFDASVRVYIHRLRKKIDEFYAVEADGADRLVIPKGEYRLVLVENERVLDEPRVATRAESPMQHRWPLAAALVLALLVVLNGAAWLVIMRPWHVDPVDQAVGSVFWKPLASNGRPTVLVTGDYYIFGEAPTSMEVTRLIRDFSINSKDDLDQYLMAHPADMGRLVDMRLHYLPTSISLALRNILPIVGRATGEREGQELLIPMSQFTPDMLKKANIVYIGYLSGLGMLREPVFDVAGFQVGSSFDELIDRRTGKHYLSDQGDVTARQSPRRDFAYIANMPGPSGTRVLIIAGTRDPALLQAAEIISDPQQLARIAASAGDAPAFEALYEVRTLDDLNLGSTLVLARGLHADKIWNLDQMRQRGFPGQGGPIPR